MELLLIEDNESKEWDIYAFDLIDQTSMGETNGRFEIRYYKNFKINTKYREYYIQEEIEYYEEGFEDVSERYVLNLFVHIGYNGNDYFEGDINNPERDY